MMRTWWENGKGSIAYHLIRFNPREYAKVEAFTITGQTYTKFAELFINPQGEHLWLGTSGYFKVDAVMVGALRQAVPTMRALARKFYQRGAMPTSYGLHERMYKVGEQVLVTDHFKYPGKDNPAHVKPVEVDFSGDAVDDC